MRKLLKENQRLSDELNTALITLKTSTESAPNGNTANDMNFTVSDIDAILDEIITARIDPEQLSNSMIQALAVIELLDEVLRNYGDAYAVGFDMTNMSIMMGANNDAMNSMSTMDIGSDNMSMDNTSASEGPKLVNIISYQTSQELATRVQEVI